MKNPDNLSASELNTQKSTNHFADGSASLLAQAINHLAMDKLKDTSIHAISAVNLMECLMPALIEMRESGEIQLTLATIQEHMALRKLTCLADRNDFSSKTSADLRSFLFSIGWQDMHGSKDQNTCLAESLRFILPYFCATLRNTTETSDFINQFDGVNVP